MLRKILLAAVLALLLLVASRARAGPLDQVPEFVASNAPTEVTLVPAPGGRVDSRRPEVGGLFTRPLRWFRLEVDGQDLSPLATLDGTTVAWQPGYDLDHGRHEALLQATDSLGRTMARRWAFQIVPPGTLPEVPVNRADLPGEDDKPKSPLTVRSPEPEQEVPRVFNVQGTTAPDSAVAVQVRDPEVAVGGVVTSRGASVDVEGKADALGHFDIEVDLRDEMFGDARVRLTVAGVAPDGRSALPVYFPIVLE